MSNYSFPPQEFEASLRRAFFGEDPADFIIVDGQSLRSKFLREGLQYALEQELIFYDAPIGTEKQMDEEQYTALKYRLTEKGRKHLGSQVLDII